MGQINMKKIYLKNFKGFKESIIEFHDVNFLVGENSTGKTSLINLITLLSSREFWYTSSFNINEIELGYFEEILSKNSSDSFFQIGIEKTIQGREKNKENSYKSRFLFNYIKSEDSTPKVEWVRASIGQLNVHLILESKKTESFYFIEEQAENFLDWQSQFEKAEFTAIPIETHLAQIPTAYLFRFVSDQIEKQAENTINELDVPTSGFFENELFSEYIQLAPIRAKPKRIYESYNVKFSPEGDHIPALLRKILSQRGDNAKIIAMLEPFGKESNLFDSIEINSYGDNDTSPFEIVVKYGDVSIKLPNVGYGVSQILPLVIEILTTRKAMFSIQQPEVHLHPKAQAAFGEFLLKAYFNYENNFIIETHSDFTINRFRYCLAQTEKKKDVSCQVLFFERKPTGNTVTKIPINHDGSYGTELPSSYQDFFIDEELKLLEL